MDNTGNYKQQNLEGMQRAVCSGRLSVQDYYERKVFLINYNNFFKTYVVLQFFIRKTQNRPQTLDSTKDILRQKISFQSYNLFWNVLLVTQEPS